MSEIKIEPDNGCYGNDEFTITGLEECTGVWLTVNKFSVWIRQQDIGVSINVYAKGAEAEDALAEALAWDCDLPEGTLNEET